ncbi:hypothetical protein [Cognatiyoonia sp. IB215182]|uniref:hypothetical protein n=1 Tax=Cognatiyoonia sp. IB215182 TaxID=3097353 RepID=UPI002A141E84|nr:hypothetical protein [Cognatiyoonia sp. IB215182]MDX8352356.1 hypothetical protein [Cognatiyoonia sp. IB215182]
MKRQRLTPQEKKAFSYAKDRRNCYGENDKSSRKNIPLSKAKAVRAVRRADKVKLQAAPFSDEVFGERIKPRWRKSPDRALGAMLDYRDAGYPENGSHSDSDRLLEKRRMRKRISRIGKLNKQADSR